jgi:hypothetical protein
MRMTIDKANQESKRGKGDGFGTKKMEKREWKKRKKFTNVF